MAFVDIALFGSVIWGCFNKNKTMVFVPTMILLTYNCLNLFLSGSNLIDNVDNLMKLEDFKWLGVVNIFNFIAGLFLITAFVLFVLSYAFNVRIKNVLFLSFMLAGVAMFVISTVFYIVYVAKIQLFWYQVFNNLMFVPLLGAIGLNAFLLLEDKGNEVSPKKDPDEEAFYKESVADKESQEKSAE